MAAVLLLAGTTQSSAQEVDDLAAKIAANSLAVGQVLDRLSDPAVAKLAVDSAIAGDGRTFNRIFDGIELPVVNKCFWISELVETLTTTSSFVEQCRVRENLTPEEWLLYTKIAVRHGEIGRGSSGAGLTGAFLDELKAYGLVSCSWVWTTTGSTGLVFQKPERFCIHTP